MKGLRTRRPTSRQVYRAARDTSLASSSVPRMMGLRHSWVGILMGELVGRWEGVEEREEEEKGSEAADKGTHNG